MSAPEVQMVPLPALVEWLRGLEAHHRSQGRSAHAAGVCSALAKIDRNARQRRRQVLPAGR